MSILNNLLPNVAGSIVNIPAEVLGIKTQVNVSIPPSLKPQTPCALCGKTQNSTTILNVTVQEKKVI